MRSIRLVILTVGMSVIGAADRAEAQDLQLNLIREDAYATRRMQVFKKAGEKISGVGGIESFDAGTNSFTMQKVTGENISVAVADLEKIEFQQALLVPNPVAQQGPFEVAAQPGATLRYKVRPDAIKFRAWDLILPASVSASTISPANSAPSSPTTHHGGHLTTQKIVEAKKLTWDSASKSFLLEVQEVVYSREEFGGSGPSGIRK